MKIDFVVPWVDSSDIRWQKKKNSFLLQQNDNMDNDVGVLRYRDTNTLKYLLRSIEKNCPWYNKIFIITEGHKPNWIDINSNKIIFISHQELYFDNNHLPTFNSSSIEMNLANIKGISEYFVYLNDDFLIMNPLEQNRFFVDNKPVDFLIHGWIPRGKIYQHLRDDSSWVKSLNNNISLINKIHKPTHISNKDNIFFHHSYPFKGRISNQLLLHVYKKYFFISHWHNAQPYKFSTIKEVYNKFAKEMMQCSQNKFRANNDLTQYLYRYYHLTKGDFYPYFYNDDFKANIKSLSSLNEIISQIEQVKPNFVSIYDNYDINEHDTIVNRLTDFLETKFTQKASFEK